ncbi:insulinase family protein [bacterium]|nr:insulinase family protein [bacterium]
MQVGKINNNIKINFKQNQGQNQTSNNQTQPELNEYQHISTLPSQYVNVNVPIGYKKINEFTLPGTAIKVQMYKLANGQTVVLAPKKGKSQIATYVKCGGMNETDNISGISHYIEHNLFNGSKNIQPKEFFDKVNQLGAYTNAYTSTSNTCYYIASHLFDSDDLTKIINLHSDMVQYPRFEQSQLVKEKGVVNSEITMYDDQNSTILHGKALKQLFQINTDENDIVCGTVKNINNLSREDVVNYYNKNYTPDKMITVLTGEFNPDEAIKLLSQKFTKPAVAQQAQYNVELKPIEKSKRTDYNSSKINTDEFVLMFKGPQNNDMKSAVCMNLLSLILCNGKHSKLGKNLEKYNIIPVFNTDRTGSEQGRPLTISLSGACKGEYTEDALKTIYSTIYNTKFEDLSEDLEIAKKSFLKEVMNEFEINTRINSYLGLMLQNYTIDDIVNNIETIKSITQDDIKNAINNFMDLNRASIVVAHPEKKSGSPSFKGRLVKEGLNLNEFTQTKLSNNINVYMKNDNNELKTMFFNLKCPVSANINPMLSSVMSKLLSNGQYGQTDSDFSKDMAKHGIDYTAFSFHDGIYIKADALNSDINYALQKIVNLLLYPKFTPQDFEKAKKQVEQEIMETQKDPNDYVTQIMFPQFKTAPTKEDKLKALSELNLGDIIGFMQYIGKNAHARFMWNKNEIPYELNRIGNLQPVTTKKMRTYTPLESDVIKTQVDDKGQAKITQVFKYERSYNPKEDLAIDVMNSILGNGQSSRLFNDLREAQKLAYRVNSRVTCTGNTGMISMNIGTTTNTDKDPSASSANITKSLEGFKKHIEKMKNEPVKQEELEAAKLEIKSRVLSTLEFNAGKMFALINGLEEYNNPDISNYILKTVDELTPEDIQKAAQKVFAGHSLISVVANEKALKEINLGQ